MSNTVPEFGGCDWPLDEGCLDASWAALDPTVKARSISMASATLRRLTAYRVGTCPITIRPNVRDGICYGVDPGGHGFLPLNWAGTWTNRTSLFHSDPRSIPLPPPVSRVDQVTVGGVVIDPDDYTVQSSRYLVWTGAGDPPWPMSQSPSLPAGDPGVFEVTYLNAAAPDGWAAYAAALMAQEFAKACKGTKCRLPNGVTAIVRQGVSYDLVPGAFPEGRTGIREVDAFIEAWNPTNRPSGMIFDPGAPRHRVV